MNWTGWTLALCAAGLALAQPASADALEDAMALPVAGGLAGAKDKARFAWVENKAGVRNIWIADKGQPARAITSFKEDDGLRSMS